MATQLAIVKIDGKYYYQDDRLREYRETTNFMNRIKFDEIGERIVEPVQAKQELNIKHKRKIR
jgi:hypothetical protein